MRNSMNAGLSAALVALIARSNAAANCAVSSTSSPCAPLRRFASNLFRLDTTSKKSLTKKRKATAWNSGYVVELLKLRPVQEI